MGIQGSGRRDYPGQAGFGVAVEKLGELLVVLSELRPQITGSPEASRALSICFTQAETTALWLNRTSELAARLIESGK